MNASEHRPARVRKAKTHRNKYPKPGPIGNTVGIIVPKTMPAPAGAPLNPPVHAETHDEQDFSWLSTHFLDEEVAAARLKVLFNNLKAHIAIHGRITTRQANALVAAATVVETPPFSKHSKPTGQVLDEIKKAVENTITPIVKQRNAASGAYITGRGRAEFASRCELIPYSERERCKKGTLHHVVPDHVFRAPDKNGQKGERYKPIDFENNKKAIPDHAQGFCICVEGAFKNSATDRTRINRKKQGKQFLPKLAEHGLIHHALDAAEALLGAIGNPKGTTTFGEMEDIGAWSVSLVTGCDANNLKKQLRKYHGSDPFNLEPNTRVRADPYGKRRDVPGASIMGKPVEDNIIYTR